MNQTPGFSQNETIKDHLSENKTVKDHDVIVEKCAQQNISHLDSYEKFSDGL